MNRDLCINGKWRSTMTLDGKYVMCRSYQIWCAMNDRCKENGHVQIKLPSYIGCYTSVNFADFQYFANWCQKQTGYGLPKYEIDKDILFEGNKIYSEDNCVFVPQALNLFLVARGNDRGIYPIGVSELKGSSKLQAHITIDGKLKRLGLHSTVESAALAYKIAKEAEARRWYKRLKDGEFIVDERVIERMRVWELADSI